MLSVLIPVHNYNITDLIKEIHGQLTSCNINFEILCFEDGSDANHIEQNSAIKRYSCTDQIVSDINLGRVVARQLLSDKAKYDWVLFLDADVMPKSPSFISAYISFIKSDYDAIYGGFAYNMEKPDPDYMLRWTYGRNNEEIPSTIRNKKPYKVIISANFLIRKKTFDQINPQIKNRGYGFDNFFGSLLKLNKIKVFHIDNEVYHLGIEKNNIYLAKKEGAAKTLLTLYNAKKISTHDNGLLSLFIKLKHYGLNYLFALIFRIFQNNLKKNILSASPSIKLLQLYRISYMCNEDLN